LQRDRGSGSKLGGIRARVSSREGLYVIAGGQAHFVDTQYQMDIGLLCF